MSPRSAFRIRPRDRGERSDDVDLVTAVGAHSCRSPRRRAPRQTRDTSSRRRRPGVQGPRHASPRTQTAHAGSPSSARPWSELRSRAPRRRLLGTGRMVAEGVRAARAAVLRHRQPRGPRRAEMQNPMYLAGVAAVMSRNDRNQRSASEREIQREDSGFNHRGRRGTRAHRPGGRQRGTHHVHHPRRGPRRPKRKTDQLGQGGRSPPGRRKGLDPEKRNEELDDRRLGSTERGAGPAATSHRHRAPGHSGDPERRYQARSLSDEPARLQRSRGPDWPGAPSATAPTADLASKPQAAVAAAPAPPERDPAAAVQRPPVAGVVDGGEVATVVPARRRGNAAERSTVRPTRSMDSWPIVMCPFRHR
jgi:hypothetical protein